MDRNPIEDLRTNSFCQTGANPITNNTRLTPGKFTDLPEGEKNVVAIQNYDNGDVNINNLYLYSSNIDTNAIWNTSKDLKRSYSLPSQSLYDSKCETNEGSGTLNSIWNSNNSLPPSDDDIKPYKVMEISIDINDFEVLDSKSVTNTKTNDIVVIKEPRDNYSLEENKKIVSMINSHDGWGVKPVNQKTPWDIPDADSNNNENYQNTFSSWFNEAPNGVCVWDSYETAKKQSVTDWSNAVKGKANSNYAMIQPKTVWSTVANDSIWNSSTAFNTCGLVGSTKVNYGATTNYDAPVTNTVSYPINERSSVARVSGGKMKNTDWPNDINRQVADCKTVASSCSVDRYATPRIKNIQSQVSDHKLYKDAQKQLVEQYQKDLCKIQEIDNDMVALSKFPEIHARPILSELLRQRQSVEQRSHSIHSHLDAVTRRLAQIEESLTNLSRVPYCAQAPIESKFSQLPAADMLATKMESMKLQQTVDFRLDVPEFVPGKRWYGLSQNGKENRNPTNGGLKTGSLEGPGDVQETPSGAPWLLIQSLPSHISIEMIQSFFVQNNTAYVTPIHSNPFSRWVLVKFPNQFSSQKAFQMLSGKVGQVSLISDQEATMKLQELKGVMARFVAH